jgi:hypothetical protein
VDIEIERLSGLEIDHQLVLGRCLNRQVGWLLALEDAINLTGRAFRIAPSESGASLSTYRWAEIPAAGQDSVESALTRTASRGVIGRSRLSGSGDRRAKRTKLGMSNGGFSGGAPFSAAGVKEPHYPLTRKL